jgi:hypothetical protein
MATTAASGIARAPAELIFFERFAGLCGIGAGVVGFLYALAFIVLRNQRLSALFLMLGGLMATAVLVALYERLRQTNAPLALWALLLGTVGSLGATVHGGYDLANTLHPPLSSSPDLPNAVDPRGLLTFGLTGVSIYTFALLMRRSGLFSGALAYLGAVSAALSIALYLGRLIVLDPARPIIVVPALLEGFVVNPAWYVWVGVVLWRGR